MRVGLALVAVTVLASLSVTAVGQANTSIEIFDMMSPGERKTVRPDWKAIAAKPLGSRDNPVRAFQPPGEHAYLGRLVCPDGARPIIHRLGSIGPGPYTSILDDYEVRCGEVVHRVIMDMYHPGYVECRAVSGLSIRGSCPGA
jgi:hypothetical protein